MIRKTPPFIVSMLFFVFACETELWSQFSEDHRNRNVDSLENVLHTNPPSETELLNIYWDLSWCYLYEDNYEKIMHYSRKGLTLAEKMDSLYIVADLYNCLGVAYDYASKVDSAMLYFEKALETVIRMEEENIEQHARIAKIKGFIYGSIANVHSIQRKTNEAFEYYFMALKLFEQYQISYEIANIFGNIGVTYYDIHNYEQAELYLQKKEKICRDNGYETNLANALTGLSIVYQFKKDYTNARMAAEEAIRILEKYNTNPADLLVCHMCLSEVYLHGYGNDVKAMEYAAIALKEAEEMKIPLEICRVLMQQSYIYLFRKNYAAAEKSALQALQIDSIHLATNQDLYECIVKANIGLGNTDKAYAYFDRFKQSQIAYANENFQKQLTEMEVKYETGKKELRITTLEDISRRRLWLLLSGGVIFLLGLATLFLLWRWTVQKKRFAEKQQQLADRQIKQLEQEKQLVATQAILDGEVQERTRLARDLHDGLGSILAAAKYNFADIKKTSEQKPADMERFDRAMCLLDDSMREMRHIAHHLMPESLSRFGLKQSISDFCDNIPCVNFSYYGDDNRLDPKQEVMIYHITHELVNNALKHAKALHILVQIVRDVDHIFLTIQDDGCGFETNRQTEGMGLKNIHNRIIAYNGNVDIHSVVGEGTEVNVKLKVIPISPSPNP